MNVECLNPFVTATFSVVEMVLGQRPIKQTVTAQELASTSEQCNVVYGITGDAQGQVIYGMPLITADRIASAMLGQPVKTFDQLAASAIGELGNMISGNAMLLLHDAGWVCDITPPTIIRGRNVAISTVGIASIVIGFKLEQGDISLTIGLQNRK